MLRLITNASAAMIVGLGTIPFSTVSNAELIDVRWNAEAKFERSQSIAPGKFLEICENLAKDSAVAWQFKASAPLNFNVHFHQGKEVAFPEKQDGVSELRGTLFAKSKEDYCWMWTNNSDAASSIRVTLNKATANR